MKQIITTILGNGQILMKEVLEGIAKQTVKCNLLVITSKREEKRSRKNYHQNLLTALQFSIKDFIIIINSNVVLIEADIIEKMIRSLEECSIVIVPMAKGVTGHDLMGIRQELVEDFKKYLYDEERCGVCEFLKGKEVKRLDNIKIKEIERLDYYE